MAAHLAGKVAIVTGAGRGIGLAVARRLALDGADVVAADLDGARAAEAARAIVALGRRGIAVEGDVAAAAGRRRYVEAALDAFGRLDVLVNNAGIIRTHRPEDVTEDEWDQIMNVNLKAVFFACTAARPHLTSTRGRIVNLASIAGKVPTPWWAPYGVSKAGVIALTRSLAVAFAPDVRVNCVCPGPAETEMWRSMNEEGAERVGFARGTFTKMRLAGTPLGRLGRPEDVAGVVSFLCSPDAEYMTGQAINISGGMVFH